MKVSVVALAIILAHVCVCCGKSSKWWESFLETPLALPASSVTYRDTKLFRQLTEALQPVTKISNNPRPEQALKINLAKFTQTKRSDSNQVHQGVVFLKQQNLNALEKILFEVSDPTSPHYGKHLTHEEVVSMTSNPNAVKRVTNYFENEGFKIVDKSLGSEFLTIEGKVSSWESVLNTKFFNFHSLSAESKPFQIHRATEYTIPHAIAHHIQAIFNIVDFPDPDYIQTAINSAVPSSVHAKHNTQAFTGYVTPQLLNTFYDIRNNTGSYLTSQGVYETIGQSFSPTDLTFFQEVFHLPHERMAVDINGHASDADCARNPNNCVEANLDVQYMMAISQHVPTTYYYWSGQDFMLDWITEVAKMTSPPEVMSISYGADENQLPASYMNAFNVMAMKLGVQGVTITASSGDDGAISTRARKNPMYCGYAPSFPASSPYVTAVGGTMGPENGEVEVACQGDRHGSITTGGGFSTLSSAPAFQTARIDAYFQTVQSLNKLPFSGYHRTGRGYPDISLLAHNYVIALNHNLTAVSGTSASSPVFAGMVGLINSARKRQGKSGLGWLNPALYAYGDQFVKDIVAGDNHCVAGGIVCCSQGFTATAGWDPVTGLGSVNFTSMLSVLSSLGSTDLPVPTLAPVTGPVVPQPPTSAAPTITPTLAPTQAAGWMYLRQYSAEECTGEIVTVSGVPTNVCMVEYDADGVVKSSRKYVCGADSVELTFYSDAQCTETEVVQSQEYYFGCAVHVQDSYYATSATSSYSVDLQCSSEGHTSIPPLPSYDGSYVLHSVYDDPTGCTAGLESSVDAFKTNHCFNLPDKQLSYQFRYPNVIVYRGLDCPKHGETQSEPLPTECTVSGNSGGNDDAYYYGESSQAILPEVVEEAPTQTTRRQLTGRDDAYYFELMKRGGNDDTNNDDDDSVYTKESDIVPSKEEDLPQGSVHRDRRQLKGQKAAATTAEEEGGGGAGNDDTNYYSSSYYYSYYDSTEESIPVLSAIKQSKARKVHRKLDGNDDDYYYSGDGTSSGNVALYEKWSLASNNPSINPSQPVSAPTLRPTIAKTTGTSAPTSALTGFQVTFSQVFTGINSKEWLQCGPSCQTVLTATLVQLIPSLIESDVEIVALHDSVSMTPTTSSFLKKKAAPQPQETKRCNVTYTITSTAAAFQVTDPFMAMNELTNWLSNTLSSGQFDLALHYHALAAQATALLTVHTQTLQSLKVTYTSDSTSETDRSDGSNTAAATSTVGSSGAASNTMVGIVVLVVVLGVVGIGLVVYFAWSTWQKGGLSLFTAVAASSSSSSNGGTAYAEVSLESDSMHANAFMAMDGRVPPQDEEELDHDNTQIQMMESQHNGGMKSEVTEEEEVSIEMTPIHHDRDHAYEAVVSEA